MEGAGSLEDESSEGETEEEEEEEEKSSGDMVCTPSATAL